MNQLIWLVTGCSSGIGEAFIHEILARGDKVIATARNASARLGYLKDSGAAILDLDITASESELSAKVAEAIQIYGNIDVLVNNAGIFEWGLIEETSPENLMYQFNTNFLGTFKMTRGILPHFRERKSGKIIFVGSANGWRAAAGCGAYSMTKFAIEGFVESLQKETTHLNIESIVFEPGQFRTTVLTSATKQSKLAGHPDYASLTAEIQADLLNSDGKQRGDPKKGAKTMVDVVKGEGMATGKVMPKRLPLGMDSLKSLREKCSETLAICEEWSALIDSTDIDEMK